MSAVFDSQVKHYTEKFYDTKDKISKESVKAKAKSMGINDESLKSGLLENSKDFRKFAFTFAATLMPGRVSCTTYASVVAVIADTYGVDYTAKTGFCLQRTNPKYEKSKADFDKKKSESGDPHPFFANHTYLTINGVDYEYFNGDTSNIDHIDVISI